ncbi:metallophosphoesterase [Bacillus sp. Marseille-Q3570]|uniref:metallophosphoesterase n=1 Tax=Bacillus sp. Marseille-Q3570 TaxID=2963522 RepID=UPI0021B6FE83|nr:metallophosphoesterase [Bacillus sp. Marseille-Q3570]
MFILLSAILISAFAIYRAYINTKDVTLKRIKVLSNDKGPQTNLRILQISDMHLENISVTPEEIHEKLKNEKIDLIALTGDYLDRKKTLTKLPAYLEVFQKLDPTYGIYAVFGNHDYVLNDKSFDKLEKILNMYDCKTLRNEHEMITINGHTVNLIGIDDFGTGKSDLEKSYKGLPVSDYNLVLTHDPNIVLDLNQQHFDYLLSGHFHNGQIHWPKPYHLAKMGKLARQKIVQGLHHMYEKPFYISEGLGQTGINIRVGSRPEITIHEVGITKAEASGNAAS